MSNPVNGTIAKAQVKGTITNDDPKPKISINDLTVSEGNAGIKNATFTVKLTNPSYQTISADYITANGTAIAPSDYNSISNTVVFAPGQTTKPVNIQIKGDRLFESNETFSVKLSDLKNVTAGDITGVGTIRNDDAQPKISISDVTVTEGSSGVVNATFQVKLTNPSSKAISANYSAVNGTATAPSDYNAKSGKVNFAPGQTIQPLTVQVKGDKLFEGNETFSVKLSGLTNVIAGDLLGVGTIRNDDIKAKALVGDAESFTLGESTSLVNQKIAFDDSISLRGSSPKERIVIPGITQPDLFAADFGWNSSGVDV